MRIAAAFLVLSAIGPRGLAQVPHRIVRVSEANAIAPVEVCVAIDPVREDHIVAVSMQSSAKKGPVTNYVYVSSDGGASWKTVPAPNPGRRVQGDDVVAFGPDGVAHRTYIAFEGLRLPKPARASNGIFTSSSADGLKWNDPVPVVDHINTVSPFEDKPWLTVDCTDSAHRGNIYVSWTKFDVYGSAQPEHKSHIYFSRSKDGGKTYAVPWRISQEPGDARDGSNTVEGAVPAVGPKGEVYVAWVGPKGIVFTRSSDGGSSFSKEKVIADNPGGWSIPVPGLPRHNGLPVAAADCSTGKDRGSVYVSWIDQRHKDPDVFLIASRDGGATWSEPLRVNDDPKGNGKAQCFAWMAVDPVDGSVNLVFYDRRDQDGAMTGLTLARSIDGGRTFVNHKIDQKPFDTGKLFLGDYIGIAARNGRVVAMYSHVLEKRQIALSAAIFRFKPGTQQTMAEKKE